MQRTWTDLHNSLRRIASISKGAQTDRLHYEYVERVQPYPIGHVFHGVTLADPDKGIQGSGPSYIDIAFRALVKSPKWHNDARASFAAYLFHGNDLAQARIKTVRDYCF